MQNNECSQIERDVRRALYLSDFKRFVNDMFFHIHGVRFTFAKHHNAICNALEQVLRGEVGRLIINIAPRYGKTELVSKLFQAYGFAVNPCSRFLHFSYSRTLTEDNSMAVKNIIRSPLFEAHFDARIGGKDSVSRWGTEQGGGMYATSTLGQITGFGAGVTDSEEEAMDYYTAIGGKGKFAGAVVIDDPLRPEEGLSAHAREAVNRRFETTIRSRVNSRRTPIVIIGQRVHEDDLCGYLMRVEPEQWKVLSLPAITTDEEGKEEALWPTKHTLEELHRLEEINPFVFQTQYMQKPMPVEGLMYAGFRTYGTLPVGRARIKNYTDTADTGSDYHCSIDYAEYQTGEMYVLSVLYTDKPMEYTEQEQARQMTGDGVQLSNIESNNGGRGFARAVERNLRLMGNSITRVAWFSQSGNKEVRIFTRSAEVQNLVYFPDGWERKWPKFHSALSSFSMRGRNAHDDAPDAVTGMVEKRDSWQTTRLART